jgi:hypothetical protein
MSSAVAARGVARRASGPGGLLVFSRDAAHAVAAWRAGQPSVAELAGNSAGRRWPGRHGGRRAAALDHGRREIRRLFPYYA